METSRSIDIELGSQEVISIDLGHLDSNPDDVLEILKESQCKTQVWTRLAAEYWKKGYPAAAERIAHAAIECCAMNATQSTLPPIYSLLANVQIAHARRAPKLVLSDARQDNMTSEKPKEEYYREAALFLNTGEKVARDAGGDSFGGTLAFLTRGIQQLATRSMDDALRSFEGVLAEKPTNLVALLGKARILYTKRQYAQSLRLFQQVLRLNPACQPDPRIGIGLCLWALDDKVKAKAAWQRSVEVNPNPWASQLLLGIESINSGKNWVSEEGRKTYLLGTRMIERVFHGNQRNAAAANALSQLLLKQGQTSKALKLAERTIQFADTLTLLTEGYLRAGRVYHAEQTYHQATKYYMQATKGQPSHVVGAIGLAQMQIQNDELAGAIHTLDTFLQTTPPPQRYIEATVILASLRSHPRPGVSSSDIASERTKARELFDRVSKGLALTTGRTHMRISVDVEMFAEIARLWQTEGDLEKVLKATTEALRISELEADGNPDAVDPRLLNNLGALSHIDGKFAEARALYERALINSMTTTSSSDREGMETSVLYNLARVYEDQGEVDMAKDAYEKLLSRHPEYIDAKIRQASMLQSLNQLNDAHLLLKQCLTSQPSNLNLRAYYTYFLIQTNMHKVAKEFVFSTLKDYDKHDIYGLCAASVIMYNQARENRDMSTKGVDERRKGFHRAAEFYEKALQLDLMCAVAAQGLAIITAEDALGTMSAPPQAQTHGADEAQRRLKNTREALDIFAKVRESMNDGSVYANMGHCYYACDEYDRAIESYETASARFYNGQNVPVLLCLCRSWYAKANKDQSYIAMSTSLKYAQAALHIQPHDKAILYNIATIQQKFAQMLFGIPPTKRTMKDLQHAIAQAAHAQKLFASLANDKAEIVPYSRDVADNRRKFGDTLLRKKDEQLETQRLHEEEAQARLTAARQKRQEEKERLEALERIRLEEKKVEAQRLAEERRKAREEALKWTQEVKMESDEEKERKTKKVRRSKAEGVASGDEAVVAAGGGEVKKKRRKLRKGGESQEALFSDEEDGAADRPAKKRATKKRVVRDDDDEVAAAPRKKQYKSKEMLSDTDDEMDMD